MLAIVTNVLIKREIHFLLSSLNVYVGPAGRRSVFISPACLTVLGDEVSWPTFGMWAREHAESRIILRIRFFWIYSTSFLPLFADHVKCVSANVVRLFAGRLWLFDHSHFYFPLSSTQINNYKEERRDYWSQTMFWLFEELVRGVASNSSKSMSFNYRLWLSFPSLLHQLVPSLGQPEREDLWHQTENRQL